MTRLCKECQAKRDYNVLFKTTRGHASEEQVTAFESAASSRNQKISPPKAYSAKPAHRPDVLRERTLHLHPVRAGSPPGRDGLRQVQVRKAIMSDFDSMPVTQNL
ncbi:MAG: hypothetical protein Q7U34_06025, partial [Anaerolineales bacterium]|nr:hypothetical protein [Anaerolineales bacterium]